ncbi:MAG: TIGR02147 family protein [Bacteriovoracaceae bacterium]
MQRPIIYHYYDQTQFLRALKGPLDESESFSYQSIADSMPDMTRSKVKKFFQGKLSLSKVKQNELLELIGLQKEEIEFFELLRRFNEAKNTEMAFGLYKKIVDWRKDKVALDTAQLDVMKLKVYEKWSTLPLLYYFDMKGASTNPEQIFRDFKGTIGIEEIQEGLSLLIELGLIEIKDQFVKKTVKSTAILDGVPRPLIKKFHHEMLSKAIHSVYHLPQEKRFHLGLTISVNNETLPLLKERMTQFIQQLNDEFSSQSGDSLYQVGLHFHNLAETSVVEQ